jgi:GT2 family glycosyltransferase
VSKPKSISVIVSVYKNVEALRVILDALEKQSVAVDEIIISEDGESREMEHFVATLHNNKIKHIRQKDEGWRKNKALNNAIRNASSQYLIFIDGDVVPHPRFVEGHIFCSKPRRVCAGKRVELGPRYSKMLIDGKLSIKQLAKRFLFKAYSLHKDGTRHFEDGIYVAPESWIYKKFIQKKTISYLIGCNFSCYKKDIESINGFDEEYVNPAIGEDVDINWRFRASGIEVISCRNIANVYHLYHKKGFGANEGEINNKILHKTIQENQFVCLNGLKKLQKGEVI